MAALRDDFTFDQVWWHAGQPDLSRLGKPHVQGGLHLGSLAQARMRQRPGDHLQAFKIDLPPGRRKWGFVKDRGGHWAKRCDRHRWRGKLALAYLNRFEGCDHRGSHEKPPTEHWMLHATDTQFRSRFPEAAWSIIVLSADIIQPVEQETIRQLLQAA